MNWYMLALRKYATFSGRAQRREYWYFVLLSCLIYVALAVVDGVTGTFDSKTGLGLFSGIYWLATLLPTLAVTIRRLHDTDRSGWWLLVALIPIIGAVALLVFEIQNGTPGDNRFGPIPETRGLQNRSQKVATTRSMATD